MSSSSPYGRAPQTMGEFSDVVAYRQICDPVPSMEGRTVLETDAFWYEVGFVAPELLSGDATAGWVDAAGEISWTLQSSEDLATWADDEMIDAAVTGIDNLDGTFTFWARRIVPLYWIDVVVDMTVGTDRQGKSITGITLFGAAVTTGMSYPYAMPADAADLQTDLRAAGYTDATVTTSSGTLVAKVRNHLSTGTRGLEVTMSGATVTAVAEYGGSTISLPSYPYTMPGSRATLQTDLRANGYAGAVVMLYQDPWEIFLPDRDASGQARDISLAISPGDPYPEYDFYGAYVGEAPAATVNGGFSNVRDPSLNPLLEAGKCFFRLKRHSLPI